MNGVFTTEYEGAYPVAFSATGYAGKLLKAYRILGGNPEREMLLRTRNMPVYKERSFPVTAAREGGTSGGFSDLYTSGRRERGGQRFDRDLGIKVEKVKNWELDAIKMKRERLEIKIKRALDYSDQLKVEIDLLDRLISDTMEESLALNQLLDIEVQSLTSGAANVVQNSDDAFGLSIGRVGDLTFSDALETGEEQDQRVPT